MTLSSRSSEELFQAYKAGDPSAYLDIRNDMEHLVRTIAKYYKDEATEEELLPIGMTYFDTALERYMINRISADNTGQELYKFSTYFTWWARESILVYLDKSTQPLIRITPRKYRK